MITYQEAVALAHKLYLSSPAIQEIQLIGSVQQKGSGNDVDFVVIAADDIAQSWWSDYQSDIKVRWPNWLYGQRWIIKKYALSVYDEAIQKKKRRRLEGAAKLLDIDLSLFFDNAGELPDFEMFLFPTDWQTEGQLSTSTVRRVTPLVDHKNTHGFMERIAHDATVIARQG